MKRTLLLTFILVCCSTFNAIAQTDSVKVETAKTESTSTQPIDIDSLTIKYLDALYEKVSNLVPRYKMYQTENIYNLLKLDTATGRVWQVQYRLGNSDSMTVSINDQSLISYWEKMDSGRFELYPTKSTYQFILIDTQTGKTWQVQWSTTPSKRFIERIYNF